MDSRSIYEVVIAGNSTMRDMFFKLSVYSIGQSPYQSLTELEMADGKRTTTSLSDTARKIGLPIHPKARVYGLPIISGHVGADAAACMLAIDIANEERIVAVMDIGTNTELIVGNKHKVLAASCPAGPAFEGGQITFGMPGLPGAIEKVAIEDDGTREAATVIGDVPRRRASAVRARRPDERAAAHRPHERPRPLRGSRPGLRRRRRATSRTMTFSEADVNALAQAKGANVAGLQIAFAEYGIDYAQLDVFYLAGGFGRHLNLESSKRIGLIPNLPAEKIVQVGNASVEGACIALLSRAKRAELEALVKRVTHCRLETHPGFFDYFVEGCQFAPVGGGGVAREPEPWKPSIRSPSFTCRTPNTTGSSAIRAVMCPASARSNSPHGRAPGMRGTAGRGPITVAWSCRRAAARCASTAWNLRHCGYRSTSSTMVRRVPCSWP